MTVGVTGDVAVLVGGDGDVVAVCRCVGDTDVIFYVVIDVVGVDRAGDVVSLVAVVFAVGGADTDIVVIGGAVDAVVIYGARDVVVVVDGDDAIVVAGSVANYAIVIVDYLGDVVVVYNGTSDVVVVVCGDDDGVVVFPCSKEGDIAVV